MRLTWRSAWQRWSFFLAFIGVFWAVNAVSQNISIPVVSDQLILKAQKEGSVRVIVQVSVPFKAEGNLINSLAVASQRKGITTAQDRLLQELRSTNYRITRRFETIPFVALEAGIQALAAVEQSGLVISVEEDRLSSPMLFESVPIVEGHQAWAKGFDGNGWTVAVLDTGVDKTHPFLSGKVVAEACFSGNGNCPNGEITQIGSGAGIPCTYAAGSCTHGTHVAGIAAGSGSSFSGVAKGANIIAIQVFSEFTGDICGDAEDPCALTYTSDWIAALMHVYNLRSSFQIAAANMSLGVGGFQAFCDTLSPSAKAAIDYLRSGEIALVAASGNNGYSSAISFPACISSAVSVGSTSKTDQVSSFSNSASFLSLLAPGQSINSSIPGGGFGLKSGTSMATPHVAGTWAIMKQKTPSATVDLVLSALKTTGLPITGTNSVTTPRIRINQALNSFISPVSDPVIGVFRPNTGRWYIDLDGNGTWSGCGPDGCWGVFGSPGDLPVAGQWDGQDKSRIGVFRPSKGMWYLDNGNGIWDGCGTDLCISGPFGSSGDIPVAGDWTKSGQTTIGVYRPSTGMWYLDNGNGIWDGCETDLCIGPFGSSGDIPVAGDWTNTGQTTIGVYRPGTRMWYLDDGNFKWDGCGTDLCIGPFGSSGDIPVAGDWTNTGQTTIGVYRPGTRMWYLDDGNFKWDGCGTDLCIGPFGSSGDIPVAGDWTNTGQTTIGVYRSGTGMWYLDTGNGTWDGCGIDFCLGPFGFSGDLPVAGVW